MRWLAFWWHGWRYRRQARHLAGEAELLPGRWDGYEYGIVEQPPKQDFYGSMTLAGEYGWLPTPEVAHEHSGWWGQTAADLAPEALEPWRGPRLHYATGLCWCGWHHDDPGPGLAPEALDEDYCPDCGAGPGDLCGAPSMRLCLFTDSGPGAGPSLAPGPDPEPELGPNAARVLARWEERRRERWRLDWDNETAAA